MNFMQHQMSQETFAGAMAVGSWADAPFFSLPEAVKALRDQLEKERIERSLRNQPVNEC
jgi:hypothetical protein